MKEYTFQTAGPDIIARVYPTMEALGDQPWRVELTDAVDGVRVCLPVTIEASSALEAATEVVEQYLIRNGYTNLSFAVSL